MAKKENQKGKLLYLQQMLLRETDNTHAITVPQIIEKFNELSIPSERKSLYNDIEVLQEAGMKIEVIRSRANQYKITERDLSAEDILLIASLLKENNNPEAVRIVNALCKTQSIYDEANIKASLGEISVPANTDTNTATQAEETVELRCDKEIQIAVLAYLKNPEVVKEKEATVTIKGSVVCDNEFYKKIFGWGTQVKIVSSPECKKSFVKYCKKILNQYK